MTWPSTSPYHVTKFALETMTDALRLEMQKFGVKVSKVQPGNFGRVTGINYPEQVSKLNPNEITTGKRTGIYYFGQYCDFI